MCVWPTLVLLECYSSVRCRRAQEITAHLRELEAQPDGAPNTVFGEALGVPSTVLEQTIDLERYANAGWLSR